ncbi:uncharacterized protein LOC134440163 [Engraulis encrasicolus]|uniref:uncharacterized protein LOC134440163 n=1 Tax=Engraulis encrasicolus TaxID=184585 RepID=UPI002FD680A3
MRLRDFFCCCLPAPGENFDDDQRSRSTKVDNSNKKKSGKGIWKRLANPSKKKLRKEAKQLRNQMADRKRKEVHVMDIITEYEEEPVKAPRPRPVKWETLYQNVEDIRIENIVFHKAWVHATQHSQDVVSPEVHVGMPEEDPGLCPRLRFHSVLACLSSSMPTCPLALTWIYCVTWSNSPRICPKEIAAEVISLPRPVRALS